MTLPVSSGGAGWIIVQGRLRPDGAADYAAYLAGTGPLLRRYRGEVVAVGPGVANPHTSDTWPINAVLRFPGVADALAFLDDPEYESIRRRYRDVAYDVLHLTLFAGRPPIDLAAPAVADVP